MPENCFMLGIELESPLADFISTENQNYNHINNFSMLSAEEAYELPSLLTKKNLLLKSGKSLPDGGTFKRVIFIDFSAAASLHKDIYEKIYSYSVNSIMTFWKNRITLTKFGRKYSHNFFSNLKLLDKTIPIQNFFSSVTKPIVIFGSGESIDKGIEYIKPCKEQYYILCADTALQPLLESGITPEGVFIEEAQNVILKAFIGTQKNDFTVFAGLSSITQLAHNFPLNKLSFFTTEYTSANFIQQLQNQNILPPVNMPFGSVGLTTFYYALCFRKNDSVPIYTYGLDFAYTKGRTHGKGTLACKNLFLNQDRFHSIYNFNSAFSKDSVYLQETDTYSTPLLLSYAALFVNLFGNEQYKNVYNSSEISNLIKLPFRLPQPFVGSEKAKQPVEFKISSEKLSSYFEQEKNALLKLKTLLTEKTNLTADQLKEEIKKMVTCREYLYLHFPDGHHFSYTQDFLNRIRIEIDYFLKIFN